MNEDGVNSGARNVGRFFLWSIPLVLGIAASVWLGVYIGIHDFHHQLTQEERAAVYTGAGSRPKSKIAVELMVRDCVQVVRADLDGSVLYLYAKNNHCEKPLTYVEYHWQELSPNGTVIHEGYTNQCSTPSVDGDIAECQFDEDHFRELPTDSRTDRIRAWTSK